ncbi:fluoride efflux transporter FluC [Paracoccus sp. (in: a-proteobacteria)]|uniref:fluoride efflux transporter FluC n=1 Tax=Paracoccus sp. TaxID=267 RepID=UPI00272B4A0D|nr:CrcB family protein [Paracoccus sp. (in: a-proteobacteria)]
MMNPYLQVAIGAAIGGMCRLAFYRSLPAQWVAMGGATLAVNVIGSFVMGLGFALVVQRLGQDFAPFLLAGVLGGFTTFSSFSLDVVALWERGEAVAAIFYVAASVILSILALIAGLAVARSVLA